MKHEFQTCRIADIAEKVAMGPFGSNIKVETFVPAGIPVISGSHLKGFYLEESDFNFITEEHAQRLKNSIVYPGDIIFTHAGNVGQAAMIPYNCHYPFYMISQRQFYLRCNKEKVLPEYLTYYFHSHEGQGKLLSNVSQVGVPSIAQPSSFLKTIEVPLPSLSVQRRIVNVLDSFTKKIEVNNQINQNLEEQAKAIFKSWFVDFEPFGGEPPDNWKTISFSTFLKPRREKSSDPSIPLFAVTNNGIIPRDAKFKKNLSRTGTQNKVAYRTDLVFGMSREILNWGIMQAEIGCVSSAYHVFAVSGNIDSQYLELYIKANIVYFKDLIRPASREGQGLDQQALMSKEILLPPDDIISAYRNISDPISSKIQQINDENQTLSSLRDTLLPKLMSGEIESLS